MDCKILVSICCLAYNHEEYIRDALEGFLKQKTDFAYEILIHDDASTDHTADIIREYEKKYPQVIRPIYQTENQYSKGVNIPHTLQYPLARGKYIAICEGDDYWTDENKLSIQISYMEKHPECSCTFHAANYLSKGKIIKNDRHDMYECDVPAETIIKEGGGYCATASLCVRREIVMGMPQYMRMAMVGDYPLQIWAALNGTLHYFPNIMSVYRIFHAGSWRHTISGNGEMQVRYLENGRVWLTRLDNETNHKYKREIYYRLAIDAQNLYRWGAEDYETARGMITNKSNHFDKKDQRHLRRGLMTAVLKRHFPWLVSAVKRLTKFGK